MACWRECLCYLTYPLPVAKISCISSPATSYSGCPLAWTLDSCVRSAYNASTSRLIEHITTCYNRELYRIKRSGNPFEVKKEVYFAKQSRVFSGLAHRRYKSAEAVSPQRAADHSTSFRPIQGRGPHHY